MLRFFAGIILIALGGPVAAAPVDPVPPVTRSEGRIDVADLWLAESAPRGIRRDE